MGAWPELALSSGCSEHSRVAVPTSHALVLHGKWIISQSCAHTTLKQDPESEFPVLEKVLGDPGSWEAPLSLPAAKGIPGLACSPLPTSLACHILPQVASSWLCPGFSPGPAARPWGWLRSWAASQAPCLILAGPGCWPLAVTPRV